MAIVGTAEVTVIANTAAFRAGLATLGSGANATAARNTGRAWGNAFVGGAQESQRKGSTPRASAALGANAEKQGKELGARQGRGHLQAYSTSLSGRGFSDVVRANARQVGALAVLAGAVAAPAAVIGQYARFNDALTESTAIMDVTAAQTQDLSNVARQSAKDLGLPAEEAAEAYFFLASAGLDAEQSLEALPQVLEFATAGNFDAAKATDLLTDAQSALGRTLKDPVQNLEEMTSLSNQLVKANQLANATVEQFSTALTNKAGKALVNTNKSTEEGLATLALFADQGIKASRAGNLLNIGLRDLPRAIAKNREEFQKVGLELEDQQGNLVNLSDIASQFTDVFGELGTVQRAALLDQLGLTRGSGDFIKALIGGGPAIARYQAQIENAGNATELVAQKQLKSLSARFRLLKSQLGDLSISFGEGFRESADQLLDGLTGGLSGAGAGDTARSLGEAAARGLKAAIDIGKQLIAILKVIASTIGVVSNALGTLNSFSGGTFGNLAKQALGLYASLRLLQGISAAGTALLPLSLLGGRRGGGAADEITKAAAATTVLATANQKLNRSVGKQVLGNRGVPGLAGTRPAKGITSTVNATKALQAANIAAAGSNLRLAASSKAAVAGVGGFARGLPAAASLASGFALAMNPLVLALVAIPAVAIAAGFGISKLVKSFKGVDPTPIKDFNESFAEIDQSVLKAQDATATLRGEIAALGEAEGPQEFGRAIARLAPAISASSKASGELDTAVNKSNESLSESAVAIQSLARLSPQLRALGGTGQEGIFESGQAQEFLSNVEKARVAQDQLTTARLKDTLQLEAARDLAKENGASSLQISRLSLAAIEARTGAVGELADAQSAAFDRISSTSGLVGVGDTDNQIQTLTQLREEYQALLRVSAQGAKLGIDSIIDAESISGEIAQIENGIRRLQTIDVNQAFAEGNFVEGLREGTNLIRQQSVERARLLATARAEGIETEKGQRLLGQARDVARQRNLEAGTLLQNAKLATDAYREQLAVTTDPQQAAFLKSQIQFAQEFGRQIVESLNLPPDAATQLLASLSGPAGGIELPVKLKADLGDFDDVKRNFFSTNAGGGAAGDIQKITFQAVTPTGAPINSQNDLINPGGGGAAGAPGLTGANQVKVTVVPVTAAGLPITSQANLLTGAGPAGGGAPAPVKIPVIPDFTAGTVGGAGPGAPANIPPIPVPAKLDFSQGAGGSGLDVGAIRTQIQNSLKNIKVSPKITISSNTSAATSAGAKLATSIASGVTKNAKKVSNAASKAVESAKTAAEGAARGAGTIGVALGLGIAAGITATTGFIVQAAVSAVQAAKSAAEAAAGIDSPSKLFRDEIGVPIAQGIAVGITQAIPQVTRALVGGIQDIVRQGRGALGQLAGTFTQTLSQITTSVNQTIQSAKQNLSSISGNIGSEIGKVINDRATEQTEGITNIVSILQQEIADLQAIDSNLSTANQRLAIEERISSEVADQASAKLKLDRLEASIAGRSAADAAAIPAAVRNQEQLRLEELRKTALEQTKAQKELSEFDARQARGADIKARQDAIKELNEQSADVRKKATEAANEVAVGLRDLATALNLGIIAPGDYAAQLKATLERNGINFDDTANRFGLTAAQSLLDNIGAATRQAGFIGGPNAPRGRGTGNQPRVINPLATFSRSVTLFRNDIVRELKTSRNTQKEQDKEIADILKEGVSKDEKERLSEVRKERESTIKQIGVLNRIEKELKKNTPTELVQQNTFNVQGGDRAFRVLQQRLSRLETLATR